MRSLRGVNVVSMIVARERLEHERVLLRGELVESLAQLAKRPLGSGEGPGRYRRPALAVLLRYGLDGRGERTLQELAGELGIAAERARQLVLEGVRMLERPWGAAAQAARRRRAFPSQAVHHWLTSGGGKRL